MKRGLFALLVASIYIVIPLASFFTEWRIADGEYKTIALVLLAMGGFFGLSNGYLSWIRPLIHQLRFGDGKELKFISAVPLLGILAVIGLLFYPANMVISGCVCFLVAFDSGSLLWFLIAVWNDESFWGFDNDSKAD